MKKKIHINIKSFSYSNKNSCNNEIIMTTKERYREMAATNLVFVYLPVLVLLLWFILMKQLLVLPGIRQSIGAVQTDSRTTSNGGLQFWHQCPSIFAIFLISNLSKIGTLVQDVLHWQTSSTGGSFVDKRPILWWRNHVTCLFLTLFSTMP